MFSNFFRHCRLAMLFYLSLNSGADMTDYEKICDFQNLYNAHKKARCGKRHKKDVILFENNLSHNLWKIKMSLENHSYKIGKYNKFMIHDPKDREIQALSYSDRVVQHALCDEVLTPFFDKRLIYDNCACRIGKGTHFGLNRLSKFMHEHFKMYGSEGYILKCDIRKYFPSISHEVLKNRIKMIIPDKNILNLLIHIIDSYEHLPDCGLPMGNQTSQLFALLYLDPVDRLVKEKLKIKHYIRYMDDMVLLSHDKLILKNCLEKMQYLVENDLQLSFNNKTQIFPIQNGVDFLGFHFYLTSTGKVIRKLRSSSKKRFKRRLQKLQKDYSCGKIEIKDINSSLASYSGHLSHGHTYKLKQKIFSTLNFVRH